MLACVPVPNAMPGSIVMYVTPLRFAFHGAHPLLAWYQCAPARRRTSRIIVAGGDPRACARLGFMGASDLDDALRKAKEALAMDAPKLRVLELPPPFFVRV